MTPASRAAGMELRDYQTAAVLAVNQHLAEPDSGHGVFVLPTGSGKTIVFAELIRDWFARWGDAGIRVLILAHRYELLEQAEAKLRQVWPDAPVGLVSAGLHRNESDRRIVVAGIQSVHKKAASIGPFNAVIVDEAHLVPSASDGMYRRLLDDLVEMNPRMRVIGCTATPFRLGGGKIYGKSRLFSKRIYDAELRALIDAGFLSPLRSKAAVAAIDTTGIAKRGGDFVQADLERRANTEELIRTTVAELLDRAVGRLSCLVFACGVDHALAVRDALRASGEDAEAVTGTTPKEERADILERFAAGELRWVVNVECLTTGLDVERIDSVVCLRPTQSTGLWVQMIGRGLRLFPGKVDCLVLDFTDNTLTHGPLDALRIKRSGSQAGASATHRICLECRELVRYGIESCPSCGHEFPKAAREPLHYAEPSEAPLFGFDAGRQEIEAVSVRRHCTLAGDDALKIGWLISCTKEWVNEYVLLGKKGGGGRRAAAWWAERFGYPVPTTVDQALDWMGGEQRIGRKLHRLTAAIVVDPRRQFPVIGFVEREASASA